jgi:superfamily II DNA or RNA helicase
MVKKSILCKQGYLLKKKYYDAETLDDLRRELTVIPHIAGDFGAKPQKFKVFRENEKYLAIPKYYGIKRFGPADKNLELQGEKVDLKFNGELRDYQKDIMKQIMVKINSDDGGLLSLGCGQGKTVMGLHVACLLKVKTLVIVHKSFLLNQWKERAEEFTNASIGIIRQNKIDIDGKDIVIGMLQSISKEKYDEELFNDFGLVIFDEAHHAPSRYFSRSLPIIASKKTLALSATPNRADKLEKVLFWYFGDTLYKAPKKCNESVLVKIMKYHCSHKKFREIRNNYNGKIIMARTLTNITKIPERNKFISKLLVELKKEEPQRKILILGDRIEQLEKIKEKFDDTETCTSDYYIGRMKMAQLKIAEEKEVIFATYSMASEALDIPSLNTLILITSRKNVEQSVGRILRRNDHEVQPLIVDIVDNLKVFINQGYCRRRYYKSLKYNIELCDVKDNEIINIEKITDNKKKSPPKTKKNDIFVESDDDGENSDAFIDSDDDEKVVSQIVNT